MDNDKCCCKAKRVRSEEEYRKLKNRLSRIEGQIRGVAKMLESDAYCIDILNQVSAVSSALGSFSKELLKQHMETCVADDIMKGNTEKLYEVLETLSRLIG